MDQDVCCELMSFTYDREDEHMKSQKCAHLKKTCRMITTADMSVVGKLHKDPGLIKSYSQLMAADG